LKPPQGAFFVAWGRGRSVLIAGIIITGAARAT